jgi:hypothetical protein
MGAQAYTLASMCQYQHGQVVVEIGAERGEGSTDWLSQFCAKREVKFYSVDLDPKQRSRSIQADGADWLRSFNQQIKFCYLDNFDYVFPGVDPENNPEIREQIERYRGFGIEMTNEGSEAAHLEQAREVHRLAAGRAIVVIDDTWWAAGLGSFRGKGARAVPWLIEKSWEVLNEVGETYDSFVALRKFI